MAAPYDILRESNQDIKDLLSDVKKGSNLYFDQMDNTFIVNEIANKSPENKWKVLLNAVDRHSPLKKEKR